MLAFRREEWVENARHVVGRDARTRVAHFDHRIALFVGSRAYTDLLSVSIALRDRLRGVHQKVEEDLAEASFIGVDGRHFPQSLGESRPVPDLVPCHLHRALDDSAHVRHSALLHVALGEGEQVPHDLSDPVRAVDRVLQRLHESREGAVPTVMRKRGDRVVTRARGAQTPENVVEIDEQVRQRIVDLVGYPSRQGPERCHSIALEELVFERRSLGHVARDEQRRVRSLEIDPGSDGLGGPIAPPSAAPPQAEHPSPTARV